MGTPNHLDKDLPFYFYLAFDGYISHESDIDALSKPHGSWSR